MQQNQSMPITSSMSRSYGIRMLFFVVLCIVFGVWGAYDYFWVIPKRQEHFQRYEQVKADHAKLQGQFQDMQNGAAYTQAEREQLRLATESKTAELNAITPNGEVPTPPSQFDRLTQIFFMTCLPCAPFFFQLYRKAKRQTYRLDEDGTLHFTGDPSLGSGQWSRTDITAIDMSRWMAKSIAYAVHADGKRLKLDAYLHRNLELIIGAIASHLYPSEWDHNGKPVKAAATEDPIEAGPAAVPGDA
jgi:hypothetical protein